MSEAFIEYMIHSNIHVCNEAFMCASLWIMSVMSLWMHLIAHMIHSEVHTNASLHTCSIATFTCVMRHSCVQWGIHECGEAFVCTSLWIMSVMSPWMHRITSMIHSEVYMNSTSRTGIHDPRSMCAMTHPCVPWLVHVCHDWFMCAMTHSCVPGLIHVGMIWCGYD